ncbi:MAG: biopolymer transporter ExbD [Myxococcales bacterium]|nr:biopolymer transporter ExbD [Myxococcales bacterium]
MTRRQVRAAMRRMREHAEEAEEETGELNLVPYMDIVTNIIIFLLASVVTSVPLGNVNVSLPTISSGGGAAADEPEKPPLNLTVTAGQTGFLIAASGGVLPAVPKKNDKYDYAELTKKLMEIKKEFPDETKATFNADAGTPYTIVVETLDAMREDTNHGLMFPDVVFAAGIL